MSIVKDVFSFHGGLMKIAFAETFSRTAQKLLCCCYDEVAMEFSLFLSALLGSKGEFPLR